MTTFVAPDARGQSPEKIMDLDVPGMWREQYGTRRQQLMKYVDAAGGQGRCR